MCRNVEYDVPAGIAIGIGVPDGIDIGIGAPGGIAIGNFYQSCWY